jgi:hypothetical protein
MPLDRLNKQSGDQINVNTRLGCCATMPALPLSERDDGMVRNYQSPNLCRSAV